MCILNLASKDVVEGAIGVLIYFEYAVLIFLATYDA